MDLVGLLRRIRTTLMHLFLSSLVPIKCQAYNFALKLKLITCWCKDIQEWSVDITETNQRKKVNLHDLTTLYNRVFKHFWYSISLPQVAMAILRNWKFPHARVKSPSNDPVYVFHSFCLLYIYAELKSSYLVQLCLAERHQRSTWPSEPSLISIT